MITFLFKNNEIVFENQDSFNHFQKLKESFSNTNVKLVMTIEEFSANISPKQIKMFQALLIQGSNESGYSYSEFEKTLIEEFAPYNYEKSITGKMTKIRKSVAEMSNKEFGIFFEQCVKFCSEFYNIKF